MRRARKRWTQESYLNKYAVVLCTVPSAAIMMCGAGGGRSKNAFAGTTSINPATADNNSSKTKANP
jgi:hypothetical protein